MDSRRFWTWHDIDLSSQDGQIIPYSASLSN